jgi:hypothetical protein
MLVQEMSLAKRGRLDFFGGKHRWLDTGKSIYEDLEPCSPPHRTYGCTVWFPMMN